MSEYGDLKKAILGQKFGLNDETETFTAGEDISPGDPLFALVGQEEIAYRAHVDAIALTADEALVSGNSIVLTVNTHALPAVSFEKSSRDTLHKLVEAVNLDDDLRDLGITAFLVEGNQLSLYLGGPGIDIEAAAEVTGGASQATFSSEAYTTAKFVGVARHMELSFKEGTGFYPRGYPAVNVMTDGKITVPVAPDAHPDNYKPAYIILSGENAGTFTDVADGNYDSGCLFRSDRIEENIVLLALRNLK